ncbi:hypothetical protein ACAF76_003790 [Brevibacillus sp. TJ4]|uniref:hypothetical protein n=1 Tax=Brevibacillus sp. TJ4 TaxID=3234853 RepID=UPI003BA11ABA
MNDICPVCNGFSSLRAACTTCSGPLEDGGRLYDYYGDYSPYREIDDAKLTNGYPDLRLHQCLHLCWCPACESEQIVTVREGSHH